MKRGSGLRIIFGLAIIGLLLAVPLASAFGFSDIGNWFKKLFGKDNIALSPSGIPFAGETRNGRCTDIDGVNPYVLGFANSTINGTKLDYCKNEVYLYEAICTGNYSTYGLTQCVNGCSDGVCLNVSNPAPKCVDSDGWNQFSIGSANSTINGKKIDYCINNFTLGEAICSGDESNYVSLYCHSGCSNGACLNENQTQTCTDSDGGLNYFVNGNVLNKTQYHEDSCSNSTILNEYYCAEEDMIWNEEHYCSNGCSNGACNPSNVYQLVNCTDASYNLILKNNFGQIKTGSQKLYNISYIYNMIDGGYKVKLNITSGNTNFGTPLLSEKQNYSTSDFNIFIYDIEGPQGVYIKWTDFASCRNQTVSCSQFGYQFGTVGASCGINSTRYDLSGCYNTTKSCIDRDAGNNSIFIFSNVSAGSTTRYGPSCGNASTGMSGGGGLLIDRCINTNILAEATCTVSNDSLLVNSTCEFGCSEGKCNSQAPQVCSELIDKKGILFNSFDKYTLYKNYTYTNNFDGDNYTVYGSDYTTSNSNDYMAVVVYVFDKNLTETRFLNEEIKEELPWMIADVKGSQVFSISIGDESFYLWYNQNVLILVGFDLSNLDRTFDYDEFVSRLQDNTFTSIAVPTHIAVLLNNLSSIYLPYCASQVNEQCSPNWQTKVEPVVCPEYGYQNIILRETSCSDRTIDIGQKSCSPGICSGCYVPRWFGYENGENVCIPYGTRLAQTYDVEVPAQENTYIEPTSDIRSGIKLNTEITDGSLSNFYILYANNSDSGFGGIGRDNTHKLITNDSMNPTLSLNLSENSYFAMSWINPEFDKSETYVFEIDDIDGSDSSKNTTTLSSINDKTTFALDIGETEDRGSIRITLLESNDRIGVAKIKLSSNTGTIYTDRIITNDGLLIHLPIRNKLPTYSNFWIMNFSEESTEGIIASGNRFAAVIDFGLDGMQVESLIGINNEVENPEGSDTFEGYVLSDLGTKTVRNTAGDQDDLMVIYFGGEDKTIAQNYNAYCNYNGNIFEQKGDDGECQNNYECSSNECRSGQCVNSYVEVTKQAGFLIRIICRINNFPLFGGTEDGYQQCIASYG